MLLLLAVSHSPTRACFSSLSWLPLPLLDTTGNHYRPFDHVYGKPLSEENRPSLKGDGEDPEAVAADFSNKDLSMHRKSEASSHVGNVTSLVWSTPKANSHYKKRMP